MPYGAYSTYTDDQLQKFTKDIEDKADQSTEFRKQKIAAIRMMYKEKIAVFKDKVEKEFKDAEPISYPKVELYGEESDPSKDIIIVSFVIQDEEKYKQIFDRVNQFLKEALRRTKLNQFFIPKNFGDQDPVNDEKIEVLFLKHNHTWERIKRKPYIIPQDQEGDEMGGELGGPPSSPPIDTGGFEEPPEPTEPEPEPPEPEGGEEA